MSSPLVFYRGAQSTIEAMAKEDGALYFATDTRTIFTDVKINNPDGTVTIERKKMSGASGVLYGNHTFAETDSDTEVDFILDDFEDETSLPTVNSLILNLPNNCFYRIVEVTDTTATGQLVAVSGSGGGSGGGSTVIGSFKAKTNTGTSASYFFSKAASTMPIDIYWRSTYEDASVTLYLYLGESTAPIVTLGNLNPDYWTTPYTLDMVSYIGDLDPNIPINIRVRLVDTEDNEKILNYVATLRTLTVTPYNKHLAAIDINSSTFNYLVYVNYERTAMVDVKIHCELYNSYNILVSTPIVQPLETWSNSARELTLQTPLSSGTYQLRTWAEGYLAVEIGTQLVATEQIITSGALEQTIVIQDPNSGELNLAVDWPDNTVSYGANSSNAVASFQVFYAGSNLADKITYAVTYTDSLNRTTTTTTEATDVVISTNGLAEVIPWNLRRVFNKAGTYVLRITVNDAISVQSGTYTVIEGTGLAIDTTSLSLNLSPVTATGYKTNSDIDKDVWTFENITSTFENFNWEDNGWIIDKEGGAALHLTNGASLTVNTYKPFTNGETPVDSHGINNSNYGGAQNTGTTIELDIKISNIRDRNHFYLSWVDAHNYDSPAAVNSGIVVDGSYIYLNSKEKHPTATFYSDGQINQEQVGLTIPYSEGERVHIAYVITPRDTTIQLTNPLQHSMVYTYINGVLSGLIQYTSSDDFGTQDAYNSPTNPHSWKLYVDSTYADVDIYNIRAYSIAHTDSSVLNNYLADLSNFDEADERYTDNDLLDSEGHISLRKVVEKGNIPYMIIRGGTECDKKGKYAVRHGKEDALYKFGAEGLPGSLDPDTDVAKKDYRRGEVQFIDPYDTNVGLKYNIGGSSSENKPDLNNPAAWKQIVYYPQGTSSLYYPVKNLRIKFIDGPAYNSDGTIQLDSSNKPVKESYSYKLFDDLPPLRLFCLKADYMDSAACHNTGMGNLVDSAYGITVNNRVVQSPATIYNPDTVTAIKGRPIILFVYPYDYESGSYDYNVRDEYENYTYVGRYNFNLDKSTPEPFGFYNDRENQYGVRMSGDTVTAGWVGIGDDDDFDPNETYYTTAPVTVNGEPDVQAAQVFDTSIIASLEGDDQDDAWKDARKTTLYRYASAEEGANSIECWEMLTNSNNYTAFRTAYAGDNVPGADVKAFSAAFEQRYPESVQKADKYCGSDKRAFLRMSQWLASTNMQTATGDSLPEPVTYDREYTEDTWQYRIAKFKNEFSDYFDAYMTAIYYIFTEMFVMMDSRAKNMMLCTFDANPEKNTGHWFPIFYDMDTMLGVNNTGFISFAYDTQDYTKGAYNGPACLWDPITEKYVDQYGQPNLAYDVLWSNFRLAFAGGELYDVDQTNELKVNPTRLYGDPATSIVGQVYSALRQRITYQNIISTFNDNQANAWNETYYNQDEWYKYLRQMDNNSLVIDNSGDTVSYTSYLYVAQGTRSLHRKQWLARRLHMLDSKYRYANTSGTYLLRAAALEDHPPGTMTFSALDTTYVWFQLMNSTYDGPYMFKGGTTKTFNLRLDYSRMTEQEGKIFFMQNILNPANLYTFSSSKFDLETQKLTGESVPVFKTKILDITGGLESWQTDMNHRENRLSSLSALSNLPFLEELYINYLNNAITTINVTSNKYLRIIEASHSKLTNIYLPWGGVLTRLKIPETLTELYLNTQTKLSTNNIINDDNTWSNIINLGVYDCPLIDSKVLFEKVKNNTNLAVNFHNFEWDIVENDCVIEERTEGNQTVREITAIPLLDKLITVPGFYYTQSVDAGGNISQNKNVQAAYHNGQLIENRANYIKGTIRIHNDNALVDTMMLYQKYSIYYPNITFTYTNNNNATLTYTLNFYDNNNRLSTYRKVASSNLASFTIDAVFNNENSPITLPSRDSTQGYRYEFLGWTRNNAQLTFVEEDGYVNIGATVISIEEARQQAEAILDVEYNADTGLYSAANDFTFNSTEVYNQNKMVANMYPVFLGIINTYNVSYYLSSTSTTPLDVVQVKYSRKANTNPTKCVPLQFNLTPITAQDQDALSVVTQVPIDIDEFGNTANYPLYETTVPGTYTSYQRMSGWVNATTGTDPANTIVYQDTRFNAVFDGNDHNCYYLDENDPYFANGGNFTYRPVQNGGGGYCAVLNADYALDAVIVPAYYILDATHRYPIFQFTIAKHEDNTMGAPQLKRIFYSDTREYSQGELSHSAHMLNWIDQDEFKDRTNLEFTGIEMCSSLQKIGNYAFQNCSNIIDTAPLPDVINQIGNGAFYQCTKVRWLNQLPSSLTTLGAQAFFKCENLRMVDFNSYNLHNIPDSCFGSCSSLNFDALTFILDIGPRAFHSDSSITGLFNNNITSYSIENIQTSAFRDANNIILNSWPTGYIGPLDNSQPVLGFIITGLETIASSVAEAKQTISMDGQKMTILNSLGLTINDISDNMEQIIENDIEIAGETVHYRQSSRPWDDQNDRPADNCRAYWSATLHQVITGYAGLRSIGSYAFYVSPSNSSYQLNYGIKFPSSLQSIGERAFENRVFALAGDNNTDEGYLDLSDCENLTSVHQNAFNGCYWQDRNHFISKIILPHSFINKEKIKAVFGFTEDEDTYFVNVTPNSASSENVVTIPLVIAEE